MEQVGEDWAKLDYTSNVPVAFLASRSHYTHNAPDSHEFNEKLSKIKQEQGRSGHCSLSGLIESRFY